MLEGLTEKEILDIDRQAEVLNCSVTTYAAGPQGLHLASFNEVGHLERSAEAEITAEPDAPRAPR